MNASACSTWPGISGAADASIPSMKSCGCWIFGRGGLYAIGNCFGSFFSGNYPEFFVGVAVGRTMTQGRLAVKAILENA